MTTDEPVPLWERIGQLRKLLWGTTDPLAADALEQYIRSLERRAAHGAPAEEAPGDVAGTPPGPAEQPKKPEKRL